MHQRGLRLFYAAGVGKFPGLWKKVFRTAMYVVPYKTVQRGQILLASQHIGASRAPGSTFTRTGHWSRRNKPQTA
ncbi:protein of unknown function [Cupriavidus neocaledonicus]|uniref:Uncharacterized protein n=1 Tax=Cupriavidus neocaledonicus TaxID=1040979 RepID=A0A375H6E0_9BURK|nr:hypothetical protein CBM2605_A70030 [Cupriavidus neocaledonicus]SPD46003.1 protein of unknown function [Cupriavidus neocaledonicus]